MNRCVRLLFGLLFLASVSLSWGQSASPYGARQDCGQIEAPEIDEASGLAASRVNSGVLWTHNDSGGFPHVYAMDTHGRSLGKLILVGANNRDWEDLAVGPGPVPGKSYLYIADTGDNDGRYRTKIIYRVPEPRLNCFRDGKYVMSADSIGLIRFRYPEGHPDAETLIIDPRNGELYVITKAEPQGRLYRIPQSDGITTAVDQGPVSVAKAVSGECAPQGDELLVKNYFLCIIGGSKATSPCARPWTNNPRWFPICPSPRARRFATMPRGAASIP